MITLNFLDDIRNLTGLAGEAERRVCLLYTSDAADERSSVDLGGRRIIKKNKHTMSDKKHYNNTRQVHSVKQQ